MAAETKYDPVPRDKFGRRWPELVEFPHQAWLCDDCGQPDIKPNKPCNHKRMPAGRVKAIGGELP